MGNGKSETKNIKPKNVDEEGEKNNISYKRKRRREQQITNSL